MGNKDRFQEMLADILEVARVQGNRLSTQEVRDLFGDMELSEAQYEQIFAYLAAYQIKIEGYVESITEYTKAVQEAGNEEDSSNAENIDTAEYNEDDRENVTPETTKAEQKEEDSVYLKMYLEDLEAIKDSTTEENYELINKIIQGDSEAKNRFIEGNLRYVIEMANDFRNQGLSLEDLIQEGNIGLMSSLENLSRLADKNEWKKFITDYVRQFIEAAIQEQKESSSFEDKIIEKTKLINDAANELAEDLGRKADIHELAACTRLSEKEISDILNMSADAVKLGDHSHEAHDPNCGHDHHHGEGHHHHHN